MVRKFLIVIVGLFLDQPADAADPAPLAVETRIALGEVSGRIDHLAIDAARWRLYVAELGNGSVGVIDATLASRSKAGLKQACARTFRSHSTSPIGTSW